MAKLTNSLFRQQNNTLKIFISYHPERFDKFTRTAAGLTLDYSKNHLVPETKNLLVDLAKQCGVDEKI
jgi:glucose-6-phosphate isomerase